jgi:hypothetical protein
MLTRMVGQRFRTESLAKDVGSDVMDWAEALLADVGEDGGGMGKGSSRVLVSYSIFAIDGRDYRRMTVQPRLKNETNDRIY